MQTRFLSIGNDPPDHFSCRISNPQRLAERDKITHLRKGEEWRKYDSPDEVEGRDRCRGILLSLQITDFQEAPLGLSILGSVFRIPGIERN